MNPDRARREGGEPDLGRAASERSRLADEHRAALAQSGSALSSGVLAERRGSSVAVAEEWLDRERGAGRLIYVVHDGTALVPTFLLDADYELTRTLPR
jgi:hypothetical protein